MKLSLATREAAGEGISRKHYLVLALIILLGAALRFAYLDRPALWGDEAATWFRTHGSFAQFLKTNRGDGFVPLHYELYWAMGRMWRLTPWLMRVVPAIAGILMIPAMYFFARQLAGRKVGLLVALLTATSAYMLNYSRDAKMYMECWLMVAWHAGCFLWWLRGGGRLAWWGWVASGCCAVGLHSTAWMAIGCEVFLLAVARRPGWVRLAAYILGMSIIAAGPLVFYLGYNRWVEKSGGLAPGATTTESVEEGRWSQSGIAWIAPHMQGKTGPLLVRDSASAYLLGYSRAEEDRDPQGNVPIDPWVLNLAWGAMAGIVIVLAVGWLNNPPLTGEADDWGWRRAFGLACWVVLPTYGIFYCRSVAAPEAPVDWLIHGLRYVGWHWLWIVPLAGGLCTSDVSVRAMGKWGGWLLVMVGVWLVADSVWQGGAQWYLSLMDVVAKPSVIGLLFVLGVLVKWHGWGEGWRKRLGQLAIVIGMLLAVLILCEVAWLIWAHLRHLAVERGESGQWQSIWMPRYLGIIWPAVAVVLGLAVMRLPGKLWRWAVVGLVIVLNLAQYGARIVMDTEPRIDLIAEDMVKARQDNSVAVFVHDRAGIGAPGAGSIYSRVGFYYLWLAGSPMSQAGEYPGRIPLVTASRRYTPKDIAREISRRLAVKRVVLWERLSEAQDINALSKDLGEAWQLSGQWQQDTRRHWNWQKLDGLRRLEFVRLPLMTSPTSQPVSLSATRPISTQAATIPAR